MIIDLCSGLGRWKSAKQDVVSIDFDKKTKPTIVADIKHLPLKPGLKPDLVHASPPCKYFSNARWINDGAKQKWDAKGIAESLRIVAACFDAFDYLEAKMWTMENPVGYLGKILNQTQIEYKAGDYLHKKTHFWSDNRSLKRAIIPQNIRDKILMLIEDS